MIPENAIVSVQEILSYVDQDRYLSKREASRYLSLCPRTLETRKDIPRFQVGKKTLFKTSELDRWMANYRVRGMEIDQIVEEAVEGLSGDRRSGSQAS